MYIFDKHMICCISVYLDVYFEGLEDMCIGEQRILTIPPHLGYGEHGFPPVIPSNSMLKFHVVYISRRKNQKP